MNITQTFYDSMAAQYDRLFLDWQATTREQAEILDRIFSGFGFGRDATLLDCACGIGTQAIGLAALGYRVTASDISAGELAEAFNLSSWDELNGEAEFFDGETVTIFVDGAESRFPPLGRAPSRIHGEPGDDVRLCLLVRRARLQCTRA